MSKRHLVVLLTVVIVIAGTAAWVITLRRPLPLEHLSLIEAWHSVYYAPQYVALHKNYFTEQGLNVQVQVASSDAAAAQVLADGRAEIALCGMEQAISAAAQQTAPPLVAFALLCQRDGTWLFTRQPSSPEVDWNLLRDKVIIGGPVGDAAELLLEAILLQQGLEPAVNVEILQHLPRPTAAKAFADGTGNYAQLYEPSVIQLEEAEEGSVFVPLAQWTRDVPLAAYHVRAAMIRDRPETLQQFTDAIRRGLRFIETHTASEIATTIAPSFPDTELAVLVESIHRYQELGVWASDPTLSCQSVNDLQNLMVQTGRLERPVNSERLFTAAFATRATQAAR